MLLVATPVSSSKPAKPEKNQRGKEIWGKRTDFSSSQRMMSKQPTLGLFFPDSEGEALSGSDVLNERVKGQEN